MLGRRLSPARWIRAGTPPSVEAELSFTRPEDIIVDPERSGLKRARTLRPDALLDHHSFDQHRCEVLDCSARPDFRPDLRVHGFAHADLSGFETLQAIITQIHAAGRVRPADAELLRRCLQGVSLPLANGQRIRLLYVAPEGLLMRTAGPNGLSINPRTSHQGIDHHDAAMAVHADQDVLGTPVKQILRGAAPWIFAHESPGRANARSPLFLLNLWIPLQQVTRPLALMDRQTLDRLAHQLRYGLPTDGFLDRAPDQRINDIWTFLHHPRQRWYFTSAMDSNTAYVFDTLSTPHGAFVLPGEARAEELYRRLHAACDAVEQGDDVGLRRALGEGTERRPRSEDEPVRTSALQQVVDAMETMLEGAPNPRLRTGPAARQRADAWCTRARRCADRVVRRSLEMRVIGVLTPRLARR